ncbi:DUF3696 domain-containing protein [Thermodesulfobacteriota bacterium]
MITKWKVQNFKSIKEETELDLASLTIFAGANSSGKSTLIQSILLIAQTLANKVSSRSVVLNGTLTSLGQFDDLKSNDSLSDQISLKCTCKPMSEDNIPFQRRSTIPPRGSMYYNQRATLLQEVSCEIAFDADPSGLNKDTGQIQPRLFSCQLTGISRDDDNIDKKSQITVRYSDRLLSGYEWLNNVAESEEQLRSSLYYKVELDKDSLSEINEEFTSAIPIGCSLKHFLPEKILLGIDTIKEDANRIAMLLQDDPRRPISMRRSIGRNIVLTKSIVNTLREILSDIINFDDVFFVESKQVSLFESEEEKIAIPIRKWMECIHSLPKEKRIVVQHALNETCDLYDKIYDALKNDANENDSKAFVRYRLPRSIIEPSLYLDQFFSSSLKYLGPLRDAPKPMYPLAPAADPYDVGLRGEHTAAILELHKQKKINYIPSSNFNNSDANRKTITRTLGSAVIDWLQYLGVANSFESKDKGKFGHELKVSLTKGGQYHDLTHVGVGVSQVLPILVMCLLADPDSTLVFEQPELHMHPKVQTRLGDFFLSMALSNKQCIVETHSEYLIDRLRFRIAASRDNGLNKYAKIYFVEKPSQSSSFREVSINEYGAIADWPEGFFDQSQDEAEKILRAALNKKRTKKTAGE